MIEIDTEVQHRAIETMLNLKEGVVTAITPTRYLVTTVEKKDGYTSTTQFALEVS